MLCCSTIASIALDRWQPAQSSCSGSRQTGHSQRWHVGHRSRADGAPHNSQWRAIFHTKLGMNLWQCLLYAIKYTTIHNGTDQQEEKIEQLMIFPVPPPKTNVSVIFCIGHWAIIAPSRDRYRWIEWLRRRRTIRVVPVGTEFPYSTRMALTGVLHRSSMDHRLICPYRSHGNHSF